MEIWFATSNKGKLSELKSLFAKEFPEAKIFSLVDLKTYSAPRETGSTFLENAMIKAKSMKAMKSHAWVVAEDSGIEVPGLGNLPGIHSARYAGPNARDSENIAKLLKMMQIRSVADRSARFVCSFVALGPEGQDWNFEGEVQGTLAKNAVGLLGFGYDPVFIPANETKTFAELGPGYKNQHSHRSKAIRQFLAKLKS